MQTYANHVHRPVATGVGYLFLIVALVALACRWFGLWPRAALAIGFLGLIGAIGTLLLISRL